MTSYAVSNLLGRVFGFLDSATMPVMANPDFIAHALIERVEAWPTAQSPTAELWIENGVLRWHDPATLADAKANAWTAAKTERDKAEAAPFEFEGGMYDPNKENVSGAALAALLAQLGGVEVSRTWTLANNSRRVLTGSQIIAMGLALTARVDAIHERGRTLRDLIDNSATPAEAYGYTWNSLDA